MKVFVTGVGGQLGYDVVNELLARGHEVIGSDVAPVYSGIGTFSGTVRPDYIQLDITAEERVAAVLQEIQPDAVVHCAAWTAVDAAEDEENASKVMAVNAQGTENIARSSDCWTAKWCIFPRIMFLTVRARSRGSRTAVTTSL